MQIEGIIRPCQCPIGMGACHRDLIRAVVQAPASPLVKYYKLSTEWTDGRMNGVPTKCWTQTDRQCRGERESEADCVNGYLAQRGGGGCRMRMRDR